MTIAVSTEIRYFWQLWKSVSTLHFREMEEVRKSFVVSGIFPLGKWEKFLMAYLITERLDIQAMLRWNRLQFAFDNVFLLS